MTVSPTALPGGEPSLATARHEARHVVAAWFVGGMHVESLSIGDHAPQEGLVIARRVNGPLGIGDLIVNLVGWMGDEHLPESAQWPEPWPLRPNTPDAVGWITEKLGLNQEQYEGSCRIAEELCENQQFKEAVELLARAALIAPRIEHDGLERLRALTPFAEPEPEEILA